MGGGDDNVLSLDCGGSYMTVFAKTQNRTLKKVNFTIRNKALRITPVTQ